MAVYVFSWNAEVLKIGKVGTKSQARYVSQHYIPGSAQSTLAASILADKHRLKLPDLDHTGVGPWIRNHVDRVNFLISGGLGIPTLTLLEAFVQCRLKPRYEGFASQRLPT